MGHNAPISQGIEARQLAPRIDSAQDIYIQEILGSTFYSALLEKFQLGTMTEPETTLVEVLKKVLVFRTFETAIPFLSIKTGAVGAYQSTDGTYVPAGKSLIEYLVNELREKAEFYTERARKCIKASLEDFPLYRSPESDIRTLDASEAYDTDLFFY